MRISAHDLGQFFSDDVKKLNPDVFGEPVAKTQGGAESKRGNKYGARKTRIGDLIFDSKKEAARYLRLQSDQERGEISDLRLQVEFTLLEGFEYRGEKVRPIRYTADFCYVRKGITYIEDVKSTATAKTADFRLRWRLLLWLHKDRDDIRCILT